MTTAQSIVTRFPNATGAQVTRYAVYRAGASSEPSITGHGAHERFRFADSSVLVVRFDGRWGLEGAKLFTLAIDDQREPTPVAHKDPAWACRVPAEDRSDCQYEW